MLRIERQRQNLKSLRIEIHLVHRTERFKNAAAVVEDKGRAERIAERVVVDRDVHASQLHEHRRDGRRREHALRPGLSPYRTVIGERKALLFCVAEQRRQEGRAAKEQRKDTP